MTTTVVYGDASDGEIRSESSDYASARAGSSSVVASTALTNQRVGQQADSFGQRSCFEAFYAFDIGAAIPPGDTITAAELQLWAGSIFTAAGWVAEARAFDWGATLTTADWVPGASLSGLPLLATWAASGPAGQLKTFTPNADELLEFVDEERAGVARILVNSSRHRIGNDPGFNASEYAQFGAADSPGTTNDPRLIIEHEPTGVRLIPATTEDVNLTGGNVAIPAPDGLEPGDQRLHVLFNIGSQTPPTTPGMSLVYGGGDGWLRNGVNSTWGVARKTAGSSEGTITHVQGGASEISAGYAFAARDADTINPINAVSGGYANNVPSGQNLPRPTTTVDGCLIVHVVTLGDGDQAPTIPGLTLHSRFWDAGSGQIGAIYYEHQATAGQVPQRTITWSSGNDQVYALCFAVAPAGSTPPASTGEVGLSLGITGTARKISRSSGNLALNLATSDDTAKTGRTEATIDTELTVDGTTVKTGAVSGAVALEVAVEAEALARKLTTGTVDLALDLAADARKATAVAAALGLTLDISGTAVRHEPGRVSGTIALALAIAATAVKHVEASGQVALTLDITGTVSKAGRTASDLGLSLGLTGTARKRDDEPRTTGHVGLTLGIEGTARKHSTTVGTLTLMLAIVGRIGSDWQLDPCRTLTVPAENRTMRVDAETRVRAIERENRTLVAAC